MAELADAQDSKSCNRKVVRVQVPPWPQKRALLCEALSYFLSPYEYRLQDEENERICDCGREDNHIHDAAEYDYLMKNPPEWRNEEIGRRVKEFHNHRLRIRAEETQDKSDPENGFCDDEDPLQNIENDFRYFLPHTPYSSFPRWER